MKRVIEASNLVRLPGSEAPPSREEIGQSVGQIIETLVAPVVEQSNLQQNILTVLLDFLTEPGLEVFNASGTKIGRAKLNEEQLKAAVRARGAKLRQSASPITLQN